MTLGQRPKIQLVITDLDNTLYDWVTFFVPALYAMVREAARILDASESEILSDLRLVHQRHGSSEHPFALIETATVEGRLNGMTRSEKIAILQPAFHAFNRTRKSELRLYDSVRDTLLALRRRGTYLVAYTDARVENALFRLVKLGIVALYDRLYAPKHRWELPPRETGYSASVPEDFVRLLPSDERKPNPALLLDICRDFAIAPASTLYVGDSLVRDVYMGNRAGVKTGWARYGTTYDKELWERLVDVTHWTERDVAEEQRLRAQAGVVVATANLERFSDMLTEFEFPTQPGRCTKEKLEA